MTRYMAEVLISICIILQWSDSVFLFDFLQRESVALAMRLIDESEVRGYRLHVEVARFELKGQYDASKKKKKSKDYKKRMQQQQKYTLLPVLFI